MKYLRILVDPVKIKGDEDDLDQVRIDLYEKLQSMIEAETLGFTIDENDEDDDEY